MYFIWIFYRVVLPPFRSAALANNLTTIVSRESLCAGSKWRCRPAIEGRKSVSPKYRMAIHPGHSMHKHLMDRHKQWIKKVWHVMCSGRRRLHTKSKDWTSLSIGSPLRQTPETLKPLRRILSLNLTQPNEY